MRSRVLLVLILTTLASPASAQYFGQNKVRHRPLNFQVMTTEHFDIHFYASERAGVDVAARLAERWYGRLQRLFGGDIESRQILVLYASQADFGQTNVIPDRISEGTGGVTEPSRRRIALPFAGPISDTDHVIGHELVHAFQYDIARALGGRANEASLERLPLWFVEGMAEYLSIGRVDGHTAMKVRDAARRNALPSIADLGTGKYFPYQWGHALMAYIGGKYGDTAIPRLLRSGLITGDLDQAFQDILGVTSQQLSDEWHDAIRGFYAAVLSASEDLPESARAAVRGPRFGTALNVAPVLSPDGRWLAFLSTRDLFSLDLYVADANTGRVVKRLTRTANDPHYSSLQFVDSSGSWNASADAFATGTVVGGRATLAIFNVFGRTGHRDIVLDGIDSILNPSWAPDGHAIVFTGMRGGLTDLYVYDFASARLRQITNDVFADLHPAWAPDSRRVVFATDRFSSDVAAMRMGPLRLAIVDTATRAIQPVNAFERGKHINPQWRSDGQAVYFIGAPDGAPNVYEVALATGEMKQITALAVGVSGITASSPAFSVSSDGAVAVSRYEDERYDIFIWRASSSSGPPRALPQDCAALPPSDRPGAIYPIRYLRSEPAPVPAQPYPVAPYKPRLSLLGVSQQTLAVGVNSFGPSIGGGASLTFADTLGDRLLATAVQTGAGGGFGLRDVAYGAGYLRLDSRWDWGLVGGQVPYMTGMAFDQETSTTASGEPMAHDRLTTYREIQRSASGVLLFPFNRIRRIELQGGVVQSLFDRTVRSSVYSLATGNRERDTSETTEIGQRLMLARSAVALVSDSTAFGPVGPIRGQRARLEISPTIGSATFAGLLVDYRRYAMPLAFYTLAVRAIHYGRYGSGADDPRLHPLYVNDPGLVRGYDDFLATCTMMLDGTCRAVRFGGSRLLVGNLELRVPLLRLFGASKQMYGAVPIELAPFVDGGVTWNRGETPAFLGGGRPGIASAGLAIRLALGMVVAEIDISRPWQREDGAHQRFGFNLIPAW